MTKEARFLRRLYWSSFALRFSVGLVGWFLTQFARIPLLQDALYYEEVGAAFAGDWLAGRSSTWLQTAPETQPRLMVVAIACCYVLTLGVRAVPLVLALYAAITAYTPLVTFRIARQIGASPLAAQWSAWLVAISPAFVFWSGALYKEGLALLVLNLVFYHALRLQAVWRGRSFVIMVVCLVGLLFLRFYLAVVVGLMVAAGLTLGRPQRRSAPVAPLIMLRQVAVVTIFSIAMVAVALTEQAQAVIPADLEDGLARIQSSRDDLASTASGYLRDVDISTPRDAVRFLPLGLWYFLVVPLPWQTGSLRQNLAIPDTALWTLLYPVILLGMLRGLRRNFQGSILLIGTTVAVCCLYALFIANVGTAYRLRIQVWLLWAVFFGIGCEALRLRPAARSRLRERAVPTP